VRPVATALAELVASTPWVDTHEHLVEERRRLTDEPYAWTDSLGTHAVIPDDWTALIVDYTLDDLVAAGLPPAVAREVVTGDAAPVEKWDRIEPFFEAARSTGYQRAVDLTTERLFGLTLSRESCEEIDARLRDLRREGYYRRVLHDVANVARCHVNSLEQLPFCETEQPELLRQDFSFLPLSLAWPHPVEELSGIEVSDLDDYLEVVDWCFARYAPRAVAAKSQWAYLRPLEVRFGPKPPQRSLKRLREHVATEAERQELEDYLFRHCLDRAQEAGLPVKLHLGYLTGTGRAGLARTFDSVTQVAPIVERFPDVTFVLMHAGWPQQEALLALAKHHPNVVVDLCWAWSLAPLSTREFVKRFLTTVPATKLLCFGGDCTTVENVVGHAELARRGLGAALAELVDEGWLTLDRAFELVPLLMHGNAERVFADPV
jgi:predicted TIM-barrel fold metal-dependent hydrolase